MAATPASEQQRSRALRAAEIGQIQIHFNSVSDSAEPQTRLHRSVSPNKATAIATLIKIIEISHGKRASRHLQGILCPLYISPYPYPFPILHTPYPIRHPNAILHPHPLRYPLLVRLIANCNMDMWTCPTIELTAALPLAHLMDINMDHRPLSHSCSSARWRWRGFQHKCINFISR